MRPTSSTTLIEYDWPVGCSNLFSGRIPLAGGRVRTPTSLNPNTGPRCWDHDTESSFCAGARTNTTDDFAGPTFLSLREDADDMRPNRHPVKLFMEAFPLCRNML